VTYCPSLDCPHRLRVRSPAEFQAHVIECSDCGAKLVASKKEARAGIRAATQPPYREGRAPTEVAERAPNRGLNDKGVGVALIVGGLALTAFTYLFSSRIGGGTYVFAWGPIAFGAYRLMRS
jgi:hypothetical protein